MSRYENQYHQTYYLQETAVIFRLMIMNDYRETMPNMSSFAGYSHEIRVNGIFNTFLRTLVIWLIWLTSHQQPMSYGNGTSAYSLIVIDNQRRNPKREVNVFKQI